jgi:hypothetical protein
MQILRVSIGTPGRRQPVASLGRKLAARPLVVGWTCLRLLAGHLFVGPCHLRARCKLIEIQLRTDMAALPLVLALALVLFVGVVGGQTGVGLMYERSIRRECCWPDERPAGPVACPVGVGAVGQSISRFSRAQLPRSRSSSASAGRSVAAPSSQCGITTAALVS